MVRHAATDPVTWGDLRRAYKKLDERITEVFDAMQEGDGNQADFWNEHEEKLNRLNRALRRLQKTVEGMIE